MLFDPRLKEITAYFEHFPYPHSRQQTFAIAPQTAKSPILQQGVTESLSCSFCLKIFANKAGLNRGFLIYKIAFCLNSIIR